MPNLGFPPSLGGLGGLGGFPGPRPPGFGFLPPGGSGSSLQGPIRRRITDKTPLSLPSGQSPGSNWSQVVKFVCLLWTARKKVSFS